LQTRGSDASALTHLEIHGAIAGLGQADWLRLHKVARALCRNGGFDADDLLQEAFQRALNGVRHCPRDLEVTRFLAGVMRSIAADWSKARRRRPEMRLNAPSGALLDVVVQVRDSSLDAEELLASTQESACVIERIKDLFADDATALTIIEGMLEGRAGAELRSAAELSEKEFASKRRLIRRRIDKAFPKEWKP
jgi:RNA polymerase sigma-70 factor (ECF subfamily)